MTMVYQWKPNVSVPVAAQIVGEELERIRVRHNSRLTQEDVVAEARDDASPLHPAFEWDDAKAGEQWRLEQASYLIRSIVVAVEANETKAPVRAFVNVERDTDRSYTSVAHAMSDAELRAQIIAKALKELKSWRDRYSELVELAKLFADIDRDMKKVRTE